MTPQRRGKYNAPRVHHIEHGRVLVQTGALSPTRQIEGKYRDLRVRATRCTRVLQRALGTPGTEVNPLRDYLLRALAELGRPNDW